MARPAASAQNVRMRLRFTDHLCEGGERADNCRALGFWYRFEDLGELGSSGCSETRGCFMTVTRHMDADDSRIDGVASPLDPAAPFQQRNEPAHRALLELQPRRESVLRKAGLARELEQCVRFRDGNRLPARGLIGPVQSESTDEPDHRLLKAGRLLEGLVRAFSCISQQFEYRTI